MKEKFIAFMQGRYGADRFGRFLMAVTALLLIISLFSRHRFVYLLALALIVYMYFRMFSRNIQKRYAENQAYLRLEGRVKSFFQHPGKAVSADGSHRIFRCPGCKQKIRVPRGKGKIAIRCPKCGTEFVKKS